MSEGNINIVNTAVSLDKSSDDAEIENNVRDALERIQDKSIVSKQKNVMDLLLRLNIKDDKEVSKESKAKITNNIFDDFLGTFGIDKSLINNERNDRKKTYNLYRFIVKNIPILDKALNVLASNVLVPELTTTNILNYKHKDLYKIVDSTLDEDEVSKLKEIDKELGISKKLKKTILKTLLVGDEFIEIVSGSELITKIDAKQEEGIKILSESYSDLGKPADTIKLLSENFTTGEFYNELEFEAFMLQEATDLKNVTKDAKTKDKLDGKVFLKRHRPEDVVKIQISEFIVGYLIVNKKKTIDKVEELYTTDLNNKDKATTSKGSVSEKFAKDVADKLFKKIKTENSSYKKFLDENEEVSDLIYNIVLEAKGVNVRFVPANRMQHFMHEGVENEDGIYGDSIFASMLMVIKHFLAVMITTTIHSLTRSVEKRKITVDVSTTDMDSDKAINEVIKAFKQKETMVANSLADLETFSTELTAFDDVFIPKVNGETPIEVDSIAGQDVGIDIEYLENLRRQILGGVDVPKALLNEYENSYHTNLAQENAMFALKIISIGNGFEPQVNDFFNKIYEIKTGNPIKSTEISFNKPITLLNESIANNLNNAQTIVDFIVSLYETADGEAGINKFEIAKLFFGDLNWEHIESIKQKFDIDKKAKTEEGGGEDDISNL